LTQSEFEVASAAALSFEAWLLNSLESGSVRLAREAICSSIELFDALYHLSPVFLYPRLRRKTEAAAGRILEQFDHGYRWPPTQKHYAVEGAASSTRHHLSLANRLLFDHWPSNLEKLIAAVGRSIVGNRPGSPVPPLLRPIMAQFTSFGPKPLVSNQEADAMVDGLAERGFSIQFSVVRNQTGWPESVTKEAIRRYKGRGGPYNKHRPKGTRTDKSLAGWQLTDCEFGMIAPLLSSSESPRTRSSRKYEVCDIIDAIFWMALGNRLALLKDKRVPSSLVYHFRKRWRRQGTLSAIVNAVNQAREETGRIKIPIGAGAFKPLHLSKLILGILTHSATPLSLTDISTRISAMHPELDELGDLPRRLRSNLYDLSHMKTVRHISGPASRWSVV
jgi:hypothetical protein